MGNHVPNIATLHKGPPRIYTGVELSVSWAVWIYTCYLVSQRAQWFSDWMNSWLTCIYWIDDLLVIEFDLLIYLFIELMIFFLLIIYLFFLNWSFHVINLMISFRKLYSSCQCNCLYWQFMRGKQISTDVVACIFWVFCQVCQVICPKETSFD